MTLHSIRFCVYACCALLTWPVRAAVNLDYVVEHLSEVAMDNSLALLPLWSASEVSTSRWKGVAQVAYNDIESHSMTLSGSPISVAVSYRFRDRWSLRGAAFFNHGELSGTGFFELAPTFLVSQPPLMLPAAAQFVLDGSVTHQGFAMSAHRENAGGWFDGSVWTFGMVWERLQLEDVFANYVLLSGNDVGAHGVVDYSANYSFFTPFIGMQWRVQRGNWLLVPHWHYAVPMPRRGFAAAISGPGFSLSGDSGAAGNGKYVSDWLLTAGISIVHRRSGIGVDLGTSIAQYLIEPFTHNGVDKNWVLAVSVEF